MLLIKKMKGAVAEARKKKARNLPERGRVSRFFDVEFKV